MITPVRILRQKNISILIQVKTNKQKKYNLHLKRKQDDEKICKQSQANQ